jgi:DNA invertase Pin-like site-specific DNA recombinase
MWRVAVFGVIALLATVAARVAAPSSSSATPARIAAVCGFELARIEQDVLSAKSMNRPGLRAALDACRSGEVAGIVVAKLDRLSKSVIDFGKLLAEANGGGWNIVGLDFGLDLSTPQGKLVANLLMSAAEWEREVIGQRTREGLAAKRFGRSRPHSDRPEALGIVLWTYRRPGRKR